MDLIRSPGFLANLDLAPLFLADIGLDDANQPDHMEPGLRTITKRISARQEECKLGDLLLN